LAGFAGPQCVETAIGDGGVDGTTSSADRCRAGVLIACHSTVMPPVET